MKNIKNALNEIWALLGFDYNVNKLVSMQRNDREELFKLSVNTFKWRRYLRSCSLSLTAWRWFKNLVTGFKNILKIEIFKFHTVHCLQMTGQGRTTEYTAKFIHITV